MSTKSNKQKTQPNLREWTKLPNTRLLSLSCRTGSPTTGSTDCRKGQTICFYLFRGDRRRLFKNRTCIFGTFWGLFFGHVLLQDWGHFWPTCRLGNPTSFRLWAWEPRKYQISFAHLPSVADQFFTAKTCSKITLTTYQTWTKQHEEHTIFIRTSTQQMLMPVLHTYFQRDVMSGNYIISPPEFISEDSFAEDLQIMGEFG